MIEKPPDVFEKNDHEFLSDSRLIMTKILANVILLAICTLIVTACGSKSQNSTPTISTTLASLSITGVSNQITLKWKNMSSAKGANSSATTSYNLYWSTSPGVSTTNGNMIANVASPFIHSGLTNGSSYYYIVTKVLSGIEGPTSPEVGTIPQTILPPSPASIAITSMDSVIQLNIDRTGNSASDIFNLYWSNTSDVVSTPILNAFGSGSTFKHTGLTNSKMYYYDMKGVSSSGATGPISSIVAATPLQDIVAVNGDKNGTTATVATPNAITAVASNQSVNLTWSMPGTATTKRIPTFFGYSTVTPSNTPVISKYNIYWSSPQPITDITVAKKITVPVTATQTLPAAFSHTGLVNNTMYYYIITATADADTNGNPLIPKKYAAGTTPTPLSFQSLQSAQIAITPTANVPSTPTGFTATTGAQSITLSWTANIGTSILYNIYEVTDILGSSPSLKGTVPTTSFVFSGLQLGKTYYYLVTAVGNGLESRPTAVISVSL